MKLTTLKSRIPSLHKPSGGWADQRRGSSNQRGYGAQWQKQRRQGLRRRAGLGGLDPFDSLGRQPSPHHRQERKVTIAGHRTGIGRAHQIADHLVLVPGLLRHWIIRPGHAGSGCP